MEDFFKIEQPKKINIKKIIIIVLIILAITFVVVVVNLYRENESLENG